MIGQETAGPLHQQLNAVGNLTYLRYSHSDKDFSVHGTAVSVLSHWASPSSYSFSLEGVDGKPFCSGCTVTKLHCLGGKVFLIFISLLLWPSQFWETFLSKFQLLVDPFLGKSWSLSVAITGG